VEIYDQLAEDDRGTTRKAILGTQAGKLLGVEPTGRRIRIDVIDKVRIRNEKYAEHWGIHTLQTVLSELRKTPTD